MEGGRERERELRGVAEHKLPLIPMEGKVQINSYSHFNAFMLMWVEREGAPGPVEEEG